MFGGNFFSGSYYGLLWYGELTILPVPTPSQRVYVDLYTQRLTVQIIRQIFAFATNYFGNGYIGAVAISINETVERDTYTDFYITQL